LLIIIILFSYFSGGWRGDEEVVAYIKDGEERRKRWDYIMLKKSTMLFSSLSWFIYQFIVRISHLIYP